MTEWIYNHIFLALAIWGSISLVLFTALTIWGIIKFNMPRKTVLEKYEEDKIYSDFMNW